jgi:hypothetical protein
MKIKCPYVSQEVTLPKKVQPNAASCYVRMGLLGSLSVPMFSNYL